MLLALNVFLTQAMTEAADRLSSFLKREDGQDAFEYMLIIGGVSVAVIIAVVAIAAASPSLRTMTCTAIATITNYGGFSCA